MLRLLTLGGLKMEKFIPYEKLSKKKKRELNAKKRKSWGAIDPVTRKTKNEKSYNRAKNRHWKNDNSFGADFSFNKKYYIFVM